MYESILALHSYWAFATLGILLIAILNSLSGISGKKPFIKRDRQIALIALAFAHTQVVLGFILYFTSPLLSTAKQEGMSEVMGNSYMRQMLVEHPLTNIIAIILITIGWSKHKKATEAGAKFKKIFFLYLIGLILLLSRIPYDQWLN
ncbi:hypothetical protein GCM10007424_25460 [Flavobacterium suaedae]|uniref:Cytochrome B n=1 Tax=Flavobacterium suaedae TaxID=1767027 RepID=A0ABQ1K530_9FLAO|nr:hypothetical protein [Flavobacterium suaedae]GGB84336.1 hypothetical protein GCM10007424_25460 [Flavobacterium suaedae]